MCYFSSAVLKGIQERQRHVIRHQHVTLDLANHLEFSSGIFSGRIERLQSGFCVRKRDLRLQEAIHVDPSMYHVHGAPRRFGEMGYQRKSAHVERYREWFGPSSIGGQQEHQRARSDEIRSCAQGQHG